jgi:hypothetical protein
MKRTLVLGTAWTASAAAAVGLGFLAVSLVDAEASPGTVPLAATSTSAFSTPSTGPAPAATAGEQTTVGGTAYASCDGGVPVLASAPSPGWSVDDSPKAGQVEFENGGQKVEVRVTCVDGAPSFSLDDSASPAVSPPASSTAGGDDRGGHGADDPAGDDSSGRSGGGHGADG